MTGIVGKSTVDPPVGVHTAGKSENYYKGVRFPAAVGCQGRSPTVVLRVVCLQALLRGPSGSRVAVRVLLWCLRVRVTS